MHFNVYGKIYALYRFLPLKIVVYLKLTIILLSIALLQLHGKTFSQTITIQQSKISLEEALIAIGKQSGHYFFYNHSEIKHANPISLDLNGVSLQQALSESFKNQPFTYNIENKTIVVTRLRETPIAEVQDLELAGVVTDDSGQPLAGATVRIKNQAIASVTNAEGKFTLSVPEGTYTLVFSYTGYVTAEVTTDGSSPLTVILKNDNMGIDEVVVVGYGTQKRSDITGAVSSMSSQQIADQSVVSLDQAMAGQMAGVQVTQTTGSPGGGASVRVRGAGSLSAGNEPLYVVDGFPVTNDYDQLNNPLNTINPADIEDIQVLKDASATAIYGSRGSNGVVIITTKSGKSGVSQIDLNIQSGFQQVEKYVDVLNAREFAHYVNESRNNAWVTSGPDRHPNDPNSVRNNVMYNLPEALSNPDALGEGTNWQREVFRNALSNNIQLNFSGGNEKTKYFVSGSYLNQDGIIINSDFKRYTFRLNLESQVHDRVKVGATITPSYTFSNVSLAEGNWQLGGIVQSAILAPPYLSPYNENGDYTKITGLGIGTSEVDNPVKIARENFFQQGNLRLLGTSFAEIDLYEGLTFKALVGTDMRNFREHTFSPSIVNPNSVNDVKIPSGTSATLESRNWLSEFTLAYNKQIQAHRFDVLAGYTMQKEQVDRNDISGTNFPNDIIKTMNAAGLITSANSFKEEWSLISYLARLNYSYAGKYLLTATFRQDGSSRFGSDNKWGFFPSVSAGWRISEEAFLKDVNWLDDLRIKASYGYTGNNFISNYGHIGLTGQENYIFGGNGGSIANGIRLSNIPNSVLGWEKNKQLDLGFELGLFNRLSFSFDYYNKLTSGLLLNVPVPSLTGYTTALQNIGEIQNRGMEFAVTSRNLDNNFKWTTDFNLSVNRIEVLALGKDGSPIISRQATSATAPTHITQIGSIPGSYYGYEVIGVYQNDADVQNSPHIVGSNGAIESKPGQLKFRDVNGDGSITTADRTILGSPFPDFTYGMTNTFLYKGVDFSFTIQGVQGFEVLNMARRYYGNYAGSYNPLRSASTGWVSEQQPGDGMSPMLNRDFNSIPGSNLVNNVTSLFIEDGSFLRIRNITLGYRVPTSSVRSIGLSSLRISLTVQNAFTFTNYEGYNPEVSAQGDRPLVPGVDAGGYPLARTYMLGLNVGF